METRQPWRSTLIPTPFSPAPYAIVAAIPAPIPNGLLQRQRRRN